VYDAQTGKNLAVSRVLGRGYESFRTKTEARQARELARAMLGRSRSAITCRQFAHRWTTGQLFTDGLKRSTVITRKQQLERFLEAYGDRPMREIADQTVAEVLAQSWGRSRVPVLRAMWNAAGSAKAGRLISGNPWAGLGLERTRGRAGQSPPSEAQVWELIAAAAEHSTMFAAWLQVAAFTGMRPGELDALQWARVDFQSGLINVIEQWSEKPQEFSLPKNGLKRVALLTPPAREALVGLPRIGEFCFVNARGSHFRPPSRSNMWARVTASTGFEGDIYLATRHFAGWYMTNVLELRAEDVAVALGHTDGGDEVRRTYGHADDRIALRRVANAYESVGSVVPLRKDMA